MTAIQIITPERGSVAETGAGGTQSADLAMRPDRAVQLVQLVEHNGQGWQYDRRRPFVRLAIAKGAGWAARADLSPAEADALAAELRRHAKAARAAGGW